MDNPSPISILRSKANQTENLVAEQIRHQVSLSSAIERNKAYIQELREAADILERLQDEHAKQSNEDTSGSEELSGDHYPF